jgi:acetylornithine deacetylase
MSSSLKGALCARVRSQAQQYVDFLRNLVRINSTVIRHGLDGNEAQAQAFIAEHLEARGFTVSTHEPDYRNIEKYPAYSPGHSYKNRPNVVGLYRGTGGGRSLILNGHVDTMEPQYLQRWSHDPFDPVVEGGRLYGVGSCDMKAGLAAMLMALEAIRDCGLRLKGDVMVQSVVD